MSLLDDTVAVAERSFYLIVRRGGSWGGGNPFRSYKGGVREVSAEVAQAVLAFKQKHPKASWLALSDMRPELEDGSLVGLQPEDLRPGSDAARRTALARGEEVGQRS